MGKGERATTVIAVKKGGKVAVASDGQVTVEDTILKSEAQKVRRLYGGKVVAGFAGAAADALALFERLEGKLQEFGGNLMRAAYELAKDWRTERALRPLEALLLVADRENILVISGRGDVIMPDDEVVGIGSGGGYAMAAARALLRFADLDAEAIAREAVKIASSICVYTNENVTVEVLEE